MPYKCCVPFCKGNYHNGPKSTMFRFPMDNDKRLEWIRAIPRENLIVTKHTRVCEQHFRNCDILRTSEAYDEQGKKIVVPLAYPRLKEDGVPCIFSGCPKYLSNPESGRADPSVKRRELENNQLKKAIEESLKLEEEYCLKYKFSTLKEFSDCVKNVTIETVWTKSVTEDCAMFFITNFAPHPTITKSVVVDKNMKVSAYVGSICLSRVSDFDLPCTIDDINKVVNLLECFKNFDLNEEFNSGNDLFSFLDDGLDSLIKMFQNYDEPIKYRHYIDVLSLVKQQLSLLNVHKTRRRYNSDFLILCTLLYSISPHAYRFLFNSTFFILPHPVTIKRLCSSYNVNPQQEQSDEHFLQYVRDKFVYLDNKDKVVVILMDEIHVKQYLDYKGGSLLGMAYDNTDVASTAYVFLIQSIQSCYKDVAHILPVKKITAEMLFSVLSKLIIGLERIGFQVICVSSDNNAINRRAMTLFSNPPRNSIVYEHPCSQSRPLFFILDSVHLYKCIRNNWFNQKNSGVCMFFPDFSNPTDPTQKLKTASLSTLRKLHEVESNDLIKLCPTLSGKALNPSSLEKQNVQLVVNIFNYSVVEGLRLAETKFSLLECKNTADFIEIICKWWDIMNVRSVFKGERKRNIFQEPLTCDESDKKIEFLNNFWVWLDTWEKFKTDTGRFTNDTHRALKHTSHAIVEIASYCKETFGLKYILTGKFQTDSLEERFGNYRQLAGGQYNISMTQVFETEKKLRIRSLMPLFMTSHTYGNISVPINDEGDTTLITDDDKDNVINVCVEKKDIDALKSKQVVLSYISGYCAHSCIKHFKCNFCKNFIVLNDIIDLLPEEDMESLTLIQNMDRGGLKYPCDEVVTIVNYSFVILTKLLSSEYESEFLKSSNHKSTAFATVTKVLNVCEIHLPFETCPNGHTSEEIRTYIIKCSINIFLKNYCKKRNDLLVSASLAKKRKLQTLKK